MHGLWNRPAGQMILQATLLLITLGIHESGQTSTHPTGHSQLGPLDPVLYHCTFPSYTALFL